MKIGDILRAKRSFVINNNNQFIKGRKYLVNNVGSDCIHITLVGPDYHKMNNMGYYTNRNINKGFYIWDYVETKIERAKRIIKQYDRK